ncbi:Phosphatidylglycerophosphatase A [Burkholderiales bacterium 8X]|nr:Phosphatidylglycerophosphatase A [Burkholderiales bacterium 8X]
MLPTSGSPIDTPPSPLHGEAPRARPDTRFLLAHPAHFIALGFGAGLSRFAPGTVGTLWAWAAFLAMQRWLSTAAIGWIILASLPLGWWACTVAARNMRVTDPGSIVWDEVIAFWLVLWLVTPAGLFGQVVAFVLFRFFDAVKPGPVKWADGCMKEPAGRAVRWPRAGFGILFDDLVAAFCTLLVIALWRAL